MKVELIVGYLDNFIRGWNVIGPDYQPYVCAPDERIEIVELNRLPNTHYRYYFFSGEIVGDEGYENPPLFHTKKRILNIEEKTGIVGRLKSLWRSTKKR